MLRYSNPEHRFSFVLPRQFPVTKRGHSIYCKRGNSCKRENSKSITNDNPFYIAVRIILEAIRSVSEMLKNAMGKFCKKNPSKRKISQSTRVLIEHNYSSGHICRGLNCEKGCPLSNDLYLGKNCQP